MSLLLVPVSQSPCHRLGLLLGLDQATIFMSPSSQLVRRPSFLLSCSLCVNGIVCSDVLDFC